MACKISFLDLVRRTCIFALFGFLAIALAGPILTMLFTVLSFALVGFLAWLPIQFLLHGRGEGLKKCRALAQRGSEMLGSACRTVVRLGKGVHATVRSTASFLGTVLLESLSGAVVGLLLVAACWPDQRLTPSAVSLAVAAGAAVGVLVVLSRVRPARTLVE